jgi:hypothetical protein
MKSRWRNLNERLGRVEREMASVEDILRDRAGHQSTSTSSPSEKGLSPPKGPIGRSISPLRRLANKMSPGSGGGGGTRTPPSAPSTYHHNAPTVAVAGDESPSAAAATRRLRPTASSADLIGQARRQSNRRPPMPLSHKHSRSTMLSDFEASSFLLADPSASPRQRDPAAGYNSNQSTPTRPPSRLRPSLASTTSSVRVKQPRESTGVKPTWNISTRRDPKDDRILPPISGRRSTLGFASGSVSGRETPTFGRPGSPALSGISAASATSNAHMKSRPMSPSRIPGPAPTYRFRSATPFQGFSDDASSSTEEHPTSMLQRAMSPTPPESLSNWSRKNGAPGTSPRRPALPLLFAPEPGSPTEELASASASGVPGAAMSSSSRSSQQQQSLSHLRNTVQTPEPTLKARAGRIASLYNRARSPGVTPSKDRIAANSSSSGAGDHHRRGGAGGRNGASGDAGSEAAGTPGGFGGGGGGGGGRSYVPNPIDVLDVELARVIGSLPLPVHIERIDPRVSKAEAKSIGPNDWIAKYLLDGTQVLCKVVDKGAKGRKVLVRADGREL